LQKLYLCSQLAFYLPLLCLQILVPIENSISINTLSRTASSLIVIFLYDFQMLLFICAYFFYFSRLMVACIFFFSCAKLVFVIWKEQIQSTYLLNFLVLEVDINQSLNIFARCFSLFSPFILLIQGIQRCLCFVLFYFVLFCY